jgi:hypothetical protein
MLLKSNVILKIKPLNLIFFRPLAHHPLSQCSLLCRSSATTAQLKIPISVQTGKIGGDSN